MNNIFPEPIMNLPEAEVPLNGVRAFLSQAKSHQILFMEFDRNVDLPEHSHEAQVGFIVEGKIKLTINGKDHIYKKGDRYYIPSGIKHSGKIYAGYADITFFNQSDRYKLKKSALNEEIEEIIEEEIIKEESSFCLPELLRLKYFEKYRELYIRQSRKNNIPIVRNYICLIQYLNEIFSYNKEHANAFGKRFKADSNDLKNGEAIFAELIVYQYYIELVKEGLLNKIELIKDEADLILEKANGNKIYLEIFSIMPPFDLPSENEKSVVFDIKTHTQNSVSSIRQKLYGKIINQKQFLQKREYYAVIELNDDFITGDFVILSSLSGGYKIQIDKNTNKPVYSGYDWSKSIFEDEKTKYIKGIIYFDKGDYSKRKIIPNPNYNTN